jgi:pilus assembly protein CpaB
VKQRFAVVLIFALVVAGASSAVLYRLISSQMSANRAAPATSRIVVASRTIEAGELIKDGDVKLGDWAGAAPAGSLTKPEDAVNRGVIDRIYEGEAIIDGRVAPRGAGAGLASIIPQGMRAVAVRMNDVAGISGFATPGQHVDVLIAGNPPGSTAGTVTKTLLQNIEILSAGQNIQKDSEGKPVIVPVVNLLVTPEQAETMSLASNEARIQLVLRNPTDKAETKTPGTSLAYLFNGGTPVPEQRPAVVRQVQVKPPPPPPPAAPTVVEAPKPPSPITVEMYTGSHRTETKFQGEDGSQGKAK